MATKADIADLKAWLKWRIILVSVAVQAPRNRRIAPVPTQTIRYRSRPTWQPDETATVGPLRKTRCIIPPPDTHRRSNESLHAAAVPGRLPWPMHKADARSGRPRSNGPARIPKGGLRPTA